MKLASAAFALFCFAILCTVSLFLLVERFRYPDMTSTRFLLVYWRLFLIQVGLALAVAWLAITKR